MNLLALECNNYQPHVTFIPVDNQPDGFLRFCGGCGVQAKVVGIVKLPVYNEDGSEKGV